MNNNIVSIAFMLILVVSLALIFLAYWYPPSWDGNKLVLNWAMDMAKVYGTALVAYVAGRASAPAKD